jgi:hypothetical protein
MLISTPATSRMFDLGNYTIDTCAYSLPPDARVIAPETLEWSWNDNEKTTIGIQHDTVGSKHLALNNISVLYMQTFLMGAISEIDGIPLKIDDYDNFTKSWENLNAMFVDKPYPGYIAVSSRYPTFKMYIGAMDRFNYLAISSTESDEMMGLIMRELKVYSREKSTTVRLQAIQKMLQAELVAILAVR